MVERALASVLPCTVVRPLQRPRYWALCCTQKRALSCCAFFFFILLPFCSFFLSLPFLMLAREWHHTQSGMTGAGLEARARTTRSRPVGGTCRMSRGMFLAGGLGIQPACGECAHDMQRACCKAIKMAAQGDRARLPAAATAFLVSKCLGTRKPPSRRAK